MLMFNSDKCKSLHFGNKNVKSVYLLGNKSIRADEEKKDRSYYPSVTEVY